MGCTPLSLTAWKRNLSQKWEKAYAEAEAAYCSAAAEALTKNYSSKPKLSTFTKTFPRIDHNTLHQHLNGGLTKQGSALKWGLLTEAQSESLISFILEMAKKGFPLSYKKIKEYALSILHTKDPTHATIGENWAQWFVACFEDWIGAKACGIMEKKCASALNPATVSNYFELLKMTLTHHNILPKNIYNCDKMV